MHAADVGSGESPRLLALLVLLLTAGAAAAAGDALLVLPLGAAAGAGDGPRLLALDLAAGARGAGDGARLLALALAAGALGAGEGLRLLLAPALGAGSLAWEEPAEDGLRLPPAGTGEGPLLGRLLPAPLAEGGRAAEALEAAARFAESCLAVGVLHPNFPRLEDLPGALPGRATLVEASSAEAKLGFCFFKSSKASSLSALPSSVFIPSKLLMPRESTQCANSSNSTRPPPSASTSEKAF